MIHRQRLQQAQSSVDAAARQMQSQGRPRYHFLPPAFWMNDPNGCIYLNGRYHLYYQHYPYAPRWGSMHWGHASSSDLVHWQHHPIALAPSEVYDDHPEGGVFSGSTICRDGKLYAFYTGTANHGSGFEQTQCMAVSDDGGETFEKYADNPVITRLPDGASPDFRDPRILWHNGCYYMVLGNSLGGGAWHGGEGCIQLYRSENLTEWHYVGIPLRSRGELGTMWECPDLFPLDDKWVLTFSPMFNGNRKARYFVGTMDFEEPAFIIEQSGELDWGGEWYASQSMKDDKGRTILIAWQNCWDWMPWWKGFGPKQSENWCGNCALPRTVRLDDQHRLISLPIEELKSLRGRAVTCSDRKIGEKPWEIPCEDPECFEMVMVLDLSAATASSLELNLRSNEEKGTLLTVDIANRRLLFNRENADEYSTGIFNCDLQPEGSLLTLHIFSDISSIEIFTDGGRTCMSNTIYPVHGSQRNILCARGGTVVLQSITVWQMKGVW